MSHPRQRTWISWIGIALVLLNLLAPGVSHALRSAGPGADAAQMAWMDLCSAAGHEAAVDRAASDDAAMSLDACSFCAHAPMAGVLPATCDTGTALTDVRHAEPELPSEAAPIPVLRLATHPRGPPAAH